MTDKNPNMIKLNIAALANELNKMIQDRARLQAKWANCVFYDTKGDIAVAENDYERRIDKLDQQIRQKQSKLRVA